MASRAGSSFCRAVRGRGGSAVRMRSRTTSALSSSLPANGRRVGRETLLVPGQAAAADKFHREVQPALGRAGGVNPDDAWVLELDLGADFETKAPTGLRVGRHLGRQHLEGLDAVEHIQVYY